MERKKVLQIMEWGNLNAVEALLIKNKLPDFNFNKENYVAELQLQINKAMDTESDDLTAFQLMAINNQLAYKEDKTSNFKTDLDEVDLEDEENFDSDDPKKWLTARQKKKIERVEDYIINKDKNELLKEVVDFIFEAHPELYKNNIGYIHSKALKKYLKSLGVPNTYNFSTEAMDAWMKVHNNYESEISRRIHEFEKSNIKDYLAMYLKWCEKNHIVSHTKKNIKIFQKQKDLKLKNSTIDELKGMAVLTQNKLL